MSSTGKQNNNDQKIEAFNKDTAYTLLDYLRNPADGTVFEDIVLENWSVFLPNTSPNATLFENIIIKVIETRYDNNGDEKARRKKARQHDISLLMFGLLDGYYHTKSGLSVSLQERYNRYLNTNILTDLEYPGEGSYAEIKERDQKSHPGRQPRPLNSITSIAKNCRREIGSDIVELIQSNGHMDCAQTAKIDEKTGIELICLNQFSH